MPAQVDMDALDALPEVMAQTALSRPTIYKWIREGRFPAPVKCGSASRWLRSEVQKYIRDRAAERGAGATA